MSLTLQSLKQNIKLRLQHRYNEREISVIQRRLLHHITGFTDAFIISEAHHNIHPFFVQQIEQAIDELAHGKPLEYVIHNAEFGHFSLWVNEAVLIPRPETEDIPQLVQKYYQREPSIILDCGTGSGCLAISLKKIYPSSKVFAFDNSETALVVAKMNALKYEADIHFFLCDFYDAHSIDTLPRDVDIFVCNPPYITSVEAKEMDESVYRFEPHNALFIQNDDYITLYGTLINIFQKVTSKHSIGILELNSLYAQEILKLACHLLNFGRYCFLEKDFRGRDRFLIVL